MVAGQAGPGEDLVLADEHVMDAGAPKPPRRRRRALAATLPALALLALATVAQAVSVLSGHTADAAWLPTVVLAALAAALGLAALLVRDVMRLLGLLERRERTLRGLAASLEQRVTARTRSLSDINQRFHAALRASGVTVFAQDRALTYTWISKGALGLTVDQIVGRSDADILPERTLAAVEPIKRAVLATGEQQHAEVLIERDGAEVWADLTVDAQRGADGAIAGLICVAVDITERREREHRIRLLLREVTHRSKNLLAVIQAIARQSSTNAASVEDFLDRFGARLHSLADSHDLLVKEDWQGAWLRDLIRSQLGPYVELVDARIEMSGPRLQLSPEAAQHVGMALHELATNAARHGALSVPQGRLRIAWSVAPDGAGEPQVRLTWEERDGPPPTPPKRRGFGRVVIERTVARALDGRVSLVYATGGVRWTLDFPASGALVETAVAASR